VLSLPHHTLLFGEHEQTIRRKNLRVAMFYEAGITDCRNPRMTAPGVWEWASQRISRRRKTLDRLDRQDEPVRSRRCALEELAEFCFILCAGQIRENGHINT
jgi:hypothetical protein